MLHVNRQIIKVCKQRLFSYTKSVRGFTLIEVVLVIAVIAIISVVSIPLSQSIIEQNNLNSALDVIRTDLVSARSFATSGKNNTSWGVHIEANNVTLFSGSSYGENPDFDQTEAIPRSITIEGTLLSGRTIDIVFLEWSGLPVLESTSGTITLTTASGKQKTLTINSQGVVYLSQNVSIVEVSCHAAYSGDWSSGSANNGNGIWRGCHGSGGTPAQDENITIDDGVAVSIDTALSKDFGDITILGTLTNNSGSGLVARSLTTQSSGSYTSFGTTVTLGGNTGTLVTVDDGSSIDSSTHFIITSDADIQVFGGTNIDSFFSGFSGSITFSPTLSTARQYVLADGGHSISNAFNILSTSHSGGVLTLTIAGSNTIDSLHLTNSGDDAVLLLSGANTINTTTLLNSSENKRLSLGTWGEQILNDISLTAGAQDSTIFFSPESSNTYGSFSATGSVSLNAQVSFLPSAGLTQTFSGLINFGENTNFVIIAPLVDFSNIPSLSFYNFTIQNNGFPVTATFPYAVTTVIANNFIVTGTAENSITLISSDDITPTQFQIAGDASKFTVTYADIKDAGCAEITGTGIGTDGFITTDTSVDSGNNGTCWFNHGIDQSQTTLDGNNISIGKTSGNGIHRIAQSFIPSVGTVSGFSLSKFTGDTNEGVISGDVIVSIEADDGSGHPDHTPIVSYTIANQDWIGLSEGPFSFSFDTPGSLTVGNTYYLVVEATSADNSNYANIDINISDLYANGSLSIFDDAGLVQNYSGYDLYFAVSY